MKHLHFFIPLLLFLSLGCTKVEKLEANRKVIEEANPNLELLIEKYKLEND